MEHQTEDFGTVPPDQVPEAYAAEPPFGAASDIVGESAGNPADIEGDLVPDGELFPEAGDGPDADGELFPEAGDGPDADGELFPDAEDGLNPDPDDMPDVDDEPDVDAGYASGIDADSPVDDAQEQPAADRGDELRPPSTMRWRRCWPRGRRPASPGSTRRWPGWMTSPGCR